MSGQLEFYDYETPRRLLSALIDSQEIEIGFKEDEIVNEPDKKLALEKIKSIINEDTPELPILLRGINKSVLKRKLAEKLNSNDSLYEGLYLAGEKAKNFLHKKSKIPTPIKYINAQGRKVAKWIFERYAELTSEQIDSEYFKNPDYKTTFCRALFDTPSLIDYYLFGLHTANSDNLVNFVATTWSPKVALHDGGKDKLVIFLWLPIGFSLYMNAEKLKANEKIITERNLPVLKDSFYPKEKEFGIKGFIPPHFMLCVHDVYKNRLVLNPALLNEKSDWIEDGLDVNQERFQDFIQTTAYHRSLLLTNNVLLKENESPPSP